MRILFLCTDVWGGHGGIALFNRELAAAFTARPGVELDVVPRIIPNPGAHPIPEGVRFHARAARGKAAYLAALLRLRRQRFDLVICGHIRLLPLTRLLRTRPLLTIHGIEAWRRHPLGTLRGVISVSALTRDRFLAWSGYQGPSWVLPNAVRLEQYGIRPRRADLVERYALEGKRVLLTVGRLAAHERYKGFDEVLEVLPDLPGDVVYLIAGGGDDAPRLQKRALDLGVSDRVLFTGIFSEQDKADLYNLADVYVMPSRGEGFGFVLLEALASGIPVIGSKHDGGREALLDGRLGMLVDPANPAEIRAAILEALTLERRIPEGLEYFAFERFVERVTAIVDAALAVRSDA